MHGEYKLSANLLDSLVVLASARGTAGGHRTIKRGGQNSSWSVARPAANTVMRCRAWGAAAARARRWQRQTRSTISRRSRLSLCWVCGEIMMKYNHALIPLERALFCRSPLRWLAGWNEYILMRARRPRVRQGHAVREDCGAVRLPALVGGRPSARRGGERLGQGQGYRGHHGSGAACARRYAHRVWARGTHWRRGHAGPAACGN